MQMPRSVWVFGDGGITRTHHVLPQRFTNARTRLVQDLGATNPIGRTRKTDRPVNDLVVDTE